jgi:hypothetical protein
MPGIGFYRCPSPAHDEALTIYSLASTSELPGAAELSTLVKNSLNLTLRIVYSKFMDATAKRLQFSPSCPRLSSYLSSRLYW